MSDACAIEARYVNHRNIQGRGVLQIILEIPVEHTTEFFNKFGHPDPGKEKRVGLALLATETDEVSVKNELAEKAKRKFEDLPYSQQAALLCKDERFQKFMKADDENDAAMWLCEKLLITSRSQLDRPDLSEIAAQFCGIRDDYRASVKSYPEQRG